MQGRLLVVSVAMDSWISDAMILSGGAEVRKEVKEVSAGQMLYVQKYRQQ